MPPAAPIVHDNLPLLETSDAAGMEHLLAEAAVRDAVVARLSPTVAVLDPAKLEALLVRLRKLGQLPKVV